MPVTVDVGDRSAELGHIREPCCAVQSYWQPLEKEDGLPTTLSESRDVSSDLINYCYNYTIQGWKNVALLEKSF